jgi:hypothetical protein
MKAMIVSAMALGLTASASFAAEPMKLTAAQMDGITAGALANVNATALNNVSANVPVSANVAVLSSGVQTASSTARTGNPVFVNATNQGP